MNRTRNPVVEGDRLRGNHLLLCCASGLAAVEFAGGTGEPNDPYQIATAEQLIAIGSDPNLATRHFVLTASIDLSGTTWSSAVIPSFSGSSRWEWPRDPGSEARGVGSLGLFGRIENTGRVVNLNIVDVDLTGTGDVGGLAAYNAGVVFDCTVPEALSARVRMRAGSSGSNSGTITGSFSTAEVTGYGLVGGLVGRNAGGILIDCHSTAVVFGNSYVGGLVGSNEGSISAMLLRTAT